MVIVQMIVAGVKCPAAATVMARFPTLASLPPSTDDRCVLAAWVVAEVETEIEIALFRIINQIHTPSSFPLSLNPYISPTKSILPSPCFMLF